ncbi:MAG: hypothetical protein FD153_556 [Rhodospirillaceae bacterium]|nr:MAG: hypothetical protein FD153_556 [Rhodospirillaceae bacterium]
MEYMVHTTSTGQEIQLSGRFTFSDHENSLSVVKLVEEDNSDRLIFNMSSLEFIDSAGLGMFLITREAAERRKL